MMHSGASDDILATYDTQQSSDLDSRAGRAPFRLGKSEPDVGTTTVVKHFLFQKGPASYPIIRVAGFPFLQASFLPFAKESTKK